LSDEFNIVGAGVEVLVGEVEADPRGVGSEKMNNTGSGESRGLRGGGGVKDDDVESSHRCCALMIGLEWISGE
jgi:hypothetical protein